MASSTSSDLSTASTTSMNTSSAVTRAKRKRSAVWTYFEEKEGNEAKCDICSLVVPTAGNTTNMMKVGW